ncbi:hypothetical protein HYQ46_005015 [Verticillium longisporum]|nr:hypothetical protein HYQ46_005015 [Verticillium longisporum]
MYKVHRASETELAVSGIVSRQLILSPPAGIPLPAGAYPPFGDHPDSNGTITLFPIVVFRYSSRQNQCHEPRLCYKPALLRN